MSESAEAVTHTAPGDRPRPMARSPVRRYRGLVTVLVVVALATRIWAGASLPNAEQDGYSYAEIAAGLTDHLRHGALTGSDFYGFWLPLFQVGTAVLNLWVHDPLIAGKILNVVCGAMSLMLVFDLTRNLTGSISWALLTFGLLLVDPFHLLYSAACMTDIPHGCVVLGSLWLAMRRQWLAAAIVACVAECMRVESWALILGLPLLQFAMERRISILALVIMLIPPIGWLGITYAATGNPLDYFQERARYHAEYLQFHRAHGLTWAIVRQDISDFLLGAGKLVTAGALAAVIIAVFKFIRIASDRDRLLAPVMFYTSMLGLIALAYVTKSQPVLLPRYGLTFLMIGLPMFAWSLQFLLRQRFPTVLKVVIVVLGSGAFLVEMSKQLPTLGKVRADFRAHQQIAAALVGGLKQLPSEARCFSDDVAVRVLSGLPRKRFLRTAFVPDSAAENREMFRQYLRQQQASFLVFFPTEDSLPVKFFPELSEANQASGDGPELVTMARSTFGPDIWLYRLR